MRDAVDGGGLRQDMDEDDCHEGESDDNQHKRVGYYQVRRQHSYCYWCGGLGGAAGGGGARGLMWW